MNIKQIIREEMDGFQWIRDEEVYYPINNINELKIGQKYYIDYRVGYDNEQLNLPVVFRSYPTRGASSYQFVGEGKDGKLRNYLFFRHSTGEGLQDMIDKGKVKYKKSELKEQDDFEWAGGMIDPFDYGKYLRLVFFVDGDKIEWTESKLKEVGYKESPHVNKHKERLRGSDRVAFIVNKAHNVLHFEGEKTYEITSVEEAKKKVRWLSAGDNSRFTMTIIDNPFNV